MELKASEWTLRTAYKDVATILDESGVIRYSELLRQTNRPEISIWHELQQLVRDDKIEIFTVGHHIMIRTEAQEL